MFSAMEEEIMQEIEALKAVYGSDCTVLQEIPAHVKVMLKPRTAEDLSQQFVEAVLVIKANIQYPIVSPELELIDSKGLDDKRHSDLLSDVQHEARMLALSPMLVALCEAAIDRISNMNHPEGNCSFCLFPLVMEDARSGLRPFMKLMSCFHCFHSDCFGRWWRWLQVQHQYEQSNSADTNLSGSGENTDEIYSGSPYSSEVKDGEGWHSVNCPVCRKVIHAEDVDHVRQFLRSGSDLQEIQNDQGSRVDNILSTEEDNNRREKFAQMFKMQQERGGIIELKKLEVILPGMFLPCSVPAAVKSVAGSNEGVLPAEEINSGQGSDQVAAANSELPSSSTSSMSTDGTKEAGNHTAIEHLDDNLRGLNFGRRGRNKLRRNDNRRSFHNQNPLPRRQTGALPTKTVWVKKE